MANHIRNIHNTRQLPGSAPLTLLVGDSHLSSLNVRELEKGLGRGARLVTPGGHQASRGQGLLLYARVAEGALPSEPAEENGSRTAG